MTKVNGIALWPQHIGSDLMQQVMRSPQRATQELFFLRQRAKVKTVLNEMETTIGSQEERKEKFAFGF